MKKSAFILCSMIAAAMTGNAVAGPGHNHGQAHLVIVTEGNALSMSLEADLLGLVGFERAPASPEEERAISEMHQSLSTGDTLFTLPERANCTLESSDTSGGYKQAEDDVPSAGEPHIVMATWSWSYEAMERLREIDVGIFANYSRIEMIETVILSEKGQSGAILTAKSTVVRMP